MKQLKVFSKAVLMSIWAFSLRNPIKTTLFVVALGVFGLHQFGKSNLKNLFTHSSEVKASLEARADKLRNSKRFMDFLEITQSQFTDSIQKRCVGEMMTYYFDKGDKTILNLLISLNNPFGLPAKNTIEEQREAMQSCLGGILQFKSIYSASRFMKAKMSDKSSEDWKFEDILYSVDKDVKKAKKSWTRIQNLSKNDIEEIHNVYTLIMNQESETNQLALSCK